MNEYFCIETVKTFSGMVSAVMLIVQLTKSIIVNSSKIPDGYVRLYTLFWALLLQGTVIYIKLGHFTIETSFLGFLNALVVTASATGIYEVATDIKAEKVKLGGNK